MRQQAILQQRPIADRSADAFRVAAKLEMYEVHLHALGAQCRDTAVWRLATSDIRELVSTSRTLPQLSADVIELARRHLKLMSSLAARRGAVPPTQQAVDIERLVESLHRKCLALVRH